MVLDANAANLVAEREQDVVVVEMTAAEEQVCLPDQFAVWGDLLVACLDQVRAIGHDVQPDRAGLVQVDPPHVPARKHREIDQTVEGKPARTPWHHHRARRSRGRRRRASREVASAAARS
jgi:hypothetical protein